MRSSHGRASLGLLSIFALSSVLHAQGVWFDAQHKNHLELQTSGIADLLMADFDGDGDDDLLSIGQLNHLARRDRPGFFVADPAGVVIAGTTSSFDAAVGDVDGDSDLDVFIACGTRFSRARPNQLWINDGTGAFTGEANTRLPFEFPGDDTRAVALRDFDGDGDLDLYLGQAEPDDSLLLNDGTGRFTPSPFPLPTGTRSSHLTAFDVDGDGDVDVVRGDLTTGSLQVLRNDGTGRLSPVGSTPSRTFFATTFATVDVNGDRRLDVIVGSHSQASPVFLNQGGALFAFSGTLPAIVDAPTSIAPIDMDGDGDSDLLVSNTPDGLIVLENRSSSYVDVTATSLPATTARILAEQIVVNDLDGDSDLDFVSAAPHRVFFNDGTGRFRDASGRHAVWIRENVQVHDFDGNGSQDIVSAYIGRGVANVDLNDGHGTFTRQPLTVVPNSPGTLDTLYGIAAEDLDGDGDVDLAIAGNGSVSSEIWANDGQARFTDVTPAVIRSNLDPTVVVASADVDGDGDQDLFFGKGRHVDRLYRNDGAGQWTDVSGAQLPARASGSVGARFGDLDGDGDLDLMLVSWDRVQNTARLYENTGNGFYLDRTSTALPTGLFPYEGGIGLGDVDGDGDLDAAFESRLLLNDGRGVFQDGTSRVTGGIGIDPRFFDVDEDGDLDLATLNHFLVNVGGGYFVQSNEFFGERVPRVYATADLDDDGDLDAVTSDGLRFNLARQLNAPAVARLGQPFTIDVHEVRHLTSPRFVLLFAAAALTSNPLTIPPIGSFHLDPATSSYLETTALAPSVEKVARSYAIPNAPALAGASFSFQGLVVPAGPNTQWRFTNAVTELVNP